MRAPPSPPAIFTRREAIRDAALAAAALAFGACNASTEVIEPHPRNDGRLAATVVPATHPAAPGTAPLGLNPARDGQLFVPAAAATGAPLPLALLLHGAGQDSNALLAPMRPIAESLGLALLAVDSRARTWDSAIDGFGPDVDFLDRALTLAFERVRVDASRLTVAGFSDGASHALSLGRINGDLLRRVAAFSPGYLRRRAPNGTPKFFVTHGTSDAVLPIDSTSRRIVPDLRAEGYDVEYHEFEGGHAITRALLEQATGWLAA